MAAPTTKTGAAQTYKFREFITKQFKDRAEQWKQERLYYQYQQQRRSGKCGAGWADDSDEEGKGKGKKKKKKKKTAQEAAEE